MIDRARLEKIFLADVAKGERSALNVFMESFEAALRERLRGTGEGMANSRTNETDDTPLGTHHCLYF